MSNWGIPDWQDPNSYGATEHWTDSRWRWEFLRRRADYRADFDKYAEQTYQDTLGYLEHIKGTPLAENRGPVLTPDSSGFVAKPRGSSVILKYPFYGLPNPRIPNQPSHVLAPSEGGLSYQIGQGQHFLLGGQNINLSVRDGQLAIAFDLDRPLAIQIGQAKILLKELQLARHEKLIRTPKHQNKWLLYLRVLDAREAGASWRSIAKILPKSMAGPNSGSPHAARSAKSVFEQADTVRKEI